MMKSVRICCMISAILLVAIAIDSTAGSNDKTVSPFEIEGLDHSPAPDFLMKTLTGKDFSLSSMKGKIVLLNFWATWCPPCRSEMPSFNRLYREMKAHGLEIIAVATDKSPDYVKEYAAKYGFDFQILWDDGRAVTKKYKVFTMPTTFLIDRQGIIVDKFFGEYDWTSPEMKKRIEKL